MTQANGSSSLPRSQGGQTALLDRPSTLPEAAYVLPRHEHEINRLDFEHFVLRQVLRGNYIAPIRSPRTILEVGGGTERWGYEMAQAFPQASVVRCDRSELKNIPYEIPRNYSFVQADVRKGLPFSDRSFDFVHQRLLFLSIPTALWPQTLRDLVRVTNVGGWLELVETRTSGQDIGPYTTQAIEWINEASRRLGIDPTLVPNLGNDLRQAGLVQVQSYSVPIPVGRWGGRIGTMMASNMVAVQQTLKALIVAQLGVDPLQFDHYLVAQQQEWETLHSNMVFDFVYGQRGA
ncbi:MAG: class I SAM-dependent methyltransferase [Ktedonobacteraceae bacterium]